MITDQDMFGNYRAYLFTPPYPVPTPTSGTTQIVQGNPTSLGTTGPANSFAYDAVGNALYFTSDGSTWVSVSSGATVNGVGTFTLPNGFNSGAVTGLGLSVAPRIVCVLGVARNTGSLLLNWTPNLSIAYTTDGFHYNLSGNTDQADYLLMYILVF